VVAEIEVRTAAGPHALQADVSEEAGGRADQGGARSLRPDSTVLVNLTPGI